MARQAHGSVLVSYGDTAVLVTAVAEAEGREGIDFFPLTVNFQTKTFAAGKIPGGFFKREGRPPDYDTLTSPAHRPAHPAPVPEELHLRDPGHRHGALPRLRRTTPTSSP